MPKITEKVVVSTEPATIKFNFDAIPKHEIDALCRDLLYSCKKAAKNPAVVAKYEQWLIKRYGKREGQRRFKAEAVLRV
ncbi:MAG: hypothetical protein LBC86_03945 [Oscillospiraceae bacterium]|jgi:hypothetical protein|nr:hypothetical protein [Oscillospiraceae bacterium]